MRMSTHMGNRPKEQPDPLDLMSALDEENVPGRRGRKGGSLFSRQARGSQGWPGQGESPQPGTEGRDCEEGCGSPMEGSGANRR